LAIFTADDHLWRPLHSRLMTELSKAGAAGATVLSGRLAYVLDDPLLPQRGWFSQPEAPMVTFLVDTRDRIARWFEVADEMTGDAGLVTCEAVRVLRDP
jgi:PII-like signaling protein